MDLILAWNMTQIVTEPTRVSKWLDLIIIQRHQSVQIVTRTPQ